MAWREESKKSEELRDLARARAKERTISYSVALAEIAREQPGLAEAARQESLKSDTVFETPREREQFTPGPMADDLCRSAKGRAEHDGVTFSEALRRVGADRPALASEYRKEVTKSKF